MKIPLIFLCPHFTIYSLLVLALFCLPGCEPNPSATREGPSAKVEKPLSSVDTSYHNGDLIFQISKSAQSRAIQLATGSRYSHMGMLFRIEGAWQVYEAVQPVKLTPLQDWIARGEQQHYVLKRVKNAPELLTPGVLEEMKKTARQQLGKPYDIYFSWDDERMYCSELIWKLYKTHLSLEIGNLKKLKTFDLNTPEVRKKLSERYGTNIPREEKVISPGDMFDSEVLIKVKEG